MGRGTRPFVVDRQWTVASLLAETFRLYWRHAPLFLALAALAVAPCVLFIHAVWGEEAFEWGLVPGSAVGVIVPVVLLYLVLPGVGIALLVRAILRIVSGERPGFGEVVRDAAPRMLPAAGTVALQAIGMGLGFFAFIVPGIWATTVWWLAPEVSVAEGRGPVDSLARSAELVKGRWWQTFGRLVLSMIVLLCVLSPLLVLYEVLDYGLAVIVVDVVIQTVTFPFYAIFATLLYLDYRRGEAVPEPEPEAAETHGGFAPPQAPQQP